MGTEVLRPQDCLIDRRSFYVKGNGNPNPRVRVNNRKPAVRPEYKKRSENIGRSEPLISNRSASLDDLRKGQNNQARLVMGHVTILRRGESIDSKLAGGDHRQRLPENIGGDLVVSGTERLGPDPEMVPKQIRIGDLRSALLSPASSSGSGGFSDVYAGSAFAMSPSPSSVPLPSFFSKKRVSKVVDGDSATRDLRRLLRLE